MLNQHVFFLEDMNGAKTKRSVVLPPTQVAAKQDVFADAMLELLMPLYFSQGLDLHRFNMTLLIAPLPPAAAAPPPPPMAIARAVRTTPKTFTFTPGKLTAPSFVPKAIATMPSDAAPPEEAFVGVSGGILGGVTNGLAPPPAPPASEGPKKPVRVGGEVKPPRLLSGPAPIYPILAQQSHIQGIVVIEAIIDEHGNVVEVRAISGHPLLIPPAMKAVSQRKYAPTVLDGEATPINLRVEINFHTG